jgi:hypothetical protein
MLQQEILVGMMLRCQMLLRTGKDGCPGLEPEYAGGHAFMPAGCRVSEAATEKLVAGIRDGSMEQLLYLRSICGGEVWQIGHAGSSFRKSREALSLSDRA